RRRCVPGPRRHRGQDRSARYGGPDRRDHRGRRRSVLPLRAPLATGTPARAVISVEDLRVAFGTAMALDGGRLSGAAGGGGGLIGRNGVWKTTLLRSLAGLVGTAGGIRLAGRPASGLSHRQRASLIAYVPQQPQLPAEMTGADYVLLGRTPHIRYFGVESQAD